MKFDYMREIHGIEYGFLKGNNQIVFIKSGLGGTCFGYENKYVKISHLLKERYGCSVIVSSNPDDNKNKTDTDRQVIEAYLTETQIDSPEFFFFGHSNGAIKGLELASLQTPVFKKMVLVNMPLMVNTHKTKAYIKAVPKTDIVAVFGEKDPSYSYLPFFKDKFENVEIKTVSQADHHFKGMLREFIELSTLLFEF